MKKEELILKIVKCSKEDECLIVGDFTIKNIVRDSTSENKQIIQKYLPNELGYNIGIYEAIVIILASIPAIDSFINLIKKFKKEKCDKQIIEITINQLLIDQMQISESKFEELKNEIMKWLENEED